MVNGVCVSSGFASAFRCSCLSVSGRPEDRTQRGSDISRTWATSPRRPFLFLVGHLGVEPKTSWSQTRRAPNCTSARCCLVYSVRTVGDRSGLPADRCPNRRSPAPRTGAITRLRHVLIVLSVARMGIEPGHRPEGLVRRLERAVSCSDRRTGRVVCWCRRALLTQWTGRRSNPRLLLFRQVLDHLSYQSVFLCWMNPRKKPDVAVTPSFA